MEHQRVISSVIYSVAYNKNTKTLEIRFNNRHLYQYFSVPERIHKGLLSALSKGTYLRANIKDKFMYKRLQ